MRRIVGEELCLDRELLALSEKDTRLGFHSEAEGYKYFPAKIRWRMNQLQELLRSEFPRVEARVGEKASLFPSYNGAAILAKPFDLSPEAVRAKGEALAREGEDPGVKFCHCRYLDKAPRMDGRPFGGLWDSLPEVVCEYWAVQYCDSFTPLEARYKEGRKTVWKAVYDRAAFYIGFYCQEGNMQNLKLPEGETDLKVFWRYGCIKLNVCRRLGSYLFFLVAPNGVHRFFECSSVPALAPGCRVSSYIGPSGWSGIMRIPFEILGISRNSARKPLRINIEKWSPLPVKGEAYNAWVAPHPIKSRLYWGSVNPAADFGWLLFKG
jgi:hypothetical protein